MDLEKQKIRFIAKVRHIGWVGYQIAAEQAYNAVPNEDQMESLLQGVKFALEHPNMTPEENHENWMKMKASQGWVYGEVKDFEKKTHPDMVPYADLPNVEMRKDTMDKTAHELACVLWTTVEDLLKANGNAEVKEMKEKLQEANLQIIEKNKVINDGKKDFKELELAVKQDLAGSKIEFKDFEKRLKKLQSQNKAHKERFKDVTDRIAKANHQMTEARVEVKKLLKTLDEKEKTLMAYIEERSDKDEEVNKAKASEQKAVKEFKVARNELNKAKDAWDKELKEVNAQRKTINDLKDIKKELEQKLNHERQKVTNGMKVIDEGISEIEKDKRYHYEPAKVEANAPLALIQVDLKGRMSALTAIRSAFMPKGRKVRTYGKCGTCGTPKITEKEMEKIDAETTPEEETAAKKALKQWEKDAKAEGNEVVECPECHTGMTKSAMMKFKETEEGK